MELEVPARCEDDHDVAVAAVRKITAFHGALVGDGSGT